MHHRFIALIALIALGFTAGTANAFSLGLGFEEPLPLQQDPLQGTNLLVPLQISDDLLLEPALGFSLQGSPGDDTFQLRLGIGAFYTFAQYEDLHFHTGLRFLWVGQRDQSEADTLALTRTTQDLQTQALLGFTYWLHVRLSLGLDLGLSATWFDDITLKATNAQGTPVQTVRTRPSTWRVEPSSRVVLRWYIW